MSFLHDLVAAAIKPENAGMVGMIKKRYQDQDQQDFFLLSVVDLGGEEFPISGDATMKWLEYKRGDRFKRLAKDVLTEGKDYSVVPRSGRRGNEIRLTVDGFKTICMAADGEKARSIRNYYANILDVFSREEQATAP